MLTTDQRGVIAELAIARAALELGVSVSRPMNDARYDLVFDIGSNLLRVQCKWVRRRGGVIVIRCYSARRDAQGFARSLYTADEVDAFAAYCAELDACYFVPFRVVPRGGTLQLRLERALNSQRLGVHWAKQYEFAATLGKQTLGAIAQLGERQLGMLEVTGSSPVGSTSR
jgi:PD-(D/E)XK endonuclease